MRKSNYNWFGLVVILVGVLLLLSRVTDLSMHLVWTVLWPCILIGVGLVSLITARRIHYWGSIMVLGGLWWLLTRLGILPHISGGVIGAVILIAAGIGIFLPNRSSGAQGGARIETQNPASEGFQSAAAEGDADPNGFVRATAVFGGCDQAMGGECFEGAELTCAFGGIELNLLGYRTFRNGCHIKANCAFGGITLILPRSVRVDRGGCPAIFGGIDNKHPNPQVDCILTLDGVCAFGGIEIRYV